jgi:ABC-type transporter Mla subunit MlaD
LKSVNEENFNQYSSVLKEKDKKIQYLQESLDQKVNELARKSSDIDNLAAQNSLLNSKIKVH